MFFKEDTQTATWAELGVSGWVILRLLRQGDRQWVSGSHSQGLPACLPSELRVALTPLPGRTDTWAGSTMDGPASGARRSLPLPPTPPSSSPYPTFWIPLEMTVGKGALSPGEGKVTGAGSTWEDDVPAAGGEVSLWAGGKQVMVLWVTFFKHSTILVTVRVSLPTHRIVLRIKVILT